MLLTSSCPYGCPLPVWIFYEIRLGGITPQAFPEVNPRAKALDPHGRTWELVP